MADTADHDLATAAAAPVVLITGGAGGMGAAAAMRFVAGGWRVALVDLDADRAATLAAGLGPQAAAFGCDVTSPTDCHATTASVLAWAGQIDHVIAAAGLWTEGDISGVTEREFDRVMAVNVKGVFFTCQAAAAAIRAAKGSMTLIASDAGIQANRGASVYCASKGAVVLLAKTLALDLAPEGVRVNAVCPGDVMTPMLDYQADAYGGGDREAYLGDLLAKYPQRDRARFIEPAEIAEFLWFLAQPGAAAINGAALSIDFGLSSGVQ
ncbi:MAG TPA: SDR family oxidoreductase [Ilumatobacteraceae bacterium]|jgi:NAD(P)-dependent dehydrogenase (short-subunit alcohol dehydrogenase family)